MSNITATQIARFITSFSSENGKDKLIPQSLDAAEKTERALFGRKRGRFRLVRQS
jgi:hypothetical protein